MRKTLVVVALTAALSGGTAVTAYADTAPASGTVAEQTAADTQTTSSDKTGLWGLLGLLGLAGLIKRRETVDSTPGTRR